MAISQISLALVSLISFPPMDHQMTAFNLTPLTSNCLLTLPCEPISDLPPSRIHPHSMDNSTLLTVLAWSLRMSLLLSHPNFLSS